VRGVGGVVLSGEEVLVAVAVEEVHPLVDLAVPEGTAVAGGTLQVVGHAGVGTILQVAVLDRFGASASGTCLTASWFSLAASLLEFIMANAIAAKSLRLLRSFDKRWTALVQRAFVLYCLGLEITRGR
jgi:hypothetical protein